MKLDEYATLAMLVAIATAIAAIHLHNLAGTAVELNEDNQRNVNPIQEQCSECQKICCCHHVP